MAMTPLIPVLSEFLIELLPCLVDLLPAFRFLIEIMTVFAGTAGMIIGVIVQVIEWMLKWGVGTRGLFEVIKVVIEALRVAWDAFVSWFWTKIVKSLENALNDLKAAWHGFQNAAQAVDRFLRAMWDSTVAWFRDKFYLPINDLITNKIPHAFRTGVDLIGFWWDRLRGIARIPVDFFINTVINKGIVGAFNLVAGWIPGLGKLSEIHPPGYAHGGEFSGMVAGPPSTVDNRIARGPHGEAIGLATGEMVINSRQTSKHKGLLYAINNGMMGYAAGGLIGAITDPAGWVKDQIGDMLGRIPGGGQMASVLLGLGNKVVAGLIEFVKGKLSFGFGNLGPTGAGPGFGAWPSSPGAQRGDSGVWRSIMALVRSTGIPYSFGNAYRPGDPLWHGSGRAVDLMGYNQDALASFFQSIGGRVLELIHRTNARDYGITRGPQPVVPDAVAAAPQPHPHRDGRGRHRRAGHGHRRLDGTRLEPANVQRYRQARARAAQRRQRRARPRHHRRTGERHRGRAHRRHDQRAAARKAVRMTTLTLDSVVNVAKHADKVCRKCGSQEWYYRKGIPWVCAPCTRRTRVMREERRRAADPIAYAETKRRNHRSWRDRNRGHLLAYGRASKIKNRLRNRAQWYGLSLDQFNDLREAQGDRCAACGDALDFEGVRGFTIDHDHSCCPGTRACGKCVRGLLCQSCNRLAVRDDWRIVAVAEYLSCGGWARSRPSR